MSFPCLNAGPVDTTNPSITITNCGTTLTNGILVVGFDAQNYPADSRVDLWVKHSGINGGTPQDVASSVLVGDGMITNNAANLIPQDGSDFTVCLRVLPDGDLDFASAPDAVSCTFTSYTPIFNSEVIEFDFFCLKQPTAESRAYFGCSGENYGGYVVPTVPSNIDLTTSSESAAQAFINTMQPGQVLRIQNANGWTLDLNSTSGSDNSKKHIIGDSDCDGSGTLTSNTIRFNIDGDHWMISDMEIVRSGTIGRIATITGSYNVMYNIRNENNTLFVYNPAGSYGNPQTVGNRFVKIFNQGPGHTDTNEGLAFRSAFTNAAGPTSQDTLIAACEFRDYGAIGTAGNGKAITDTSWFWADVFATGQGAQPGPAPKIYVEIVGCHFVDCLDETITVKSDAYWIHENLFESDNAGHISLRSGNGSCINNNFVFVNAGSGIRIASGQRHEGYFNVVYSGNDSGLGVAHAARTVFQSGFLARRPQNKLNKFKNNLFLGPGASTGMLRYLFDDEHLPAYPTEDNEYSDNVYVGPQSDISPYGSASAIADAGVNATQAGYDANNPGSGLDDQIWSTRTSGDCFQTPELVEMPLEMDTGKTWIDGRSMKATIRPEFIGPGGLFIDTSV